jgi:hypothetical protein
VSSQRYPYLPSEIRAQDGTVYKFSTILGEAGNGATDEADYRARLDAAAEQWQAFARQQNYPPGAAPSTPLSPAPRSDAPWQGPVQETAASSDRTPYLPAAIVGNDGKTYYLADALRRAADIREHGDVSPNARQERIDAAAEQWQQFARLMNGYPHHPAPGVPGSPENQAAMQADKWVSDAAHVDSGAYPQMPSAIRLPSAPYNRNFVPPVNPNRMTTLQDYLEDGIRRGVPVDQLAIEWQQLVERATGEQVKRAPAPAPAPAPPPAPAPVSTRAPSEQWKDRVRAEGR